MEDVIKVASLLWENKELIIGSISTIIASAAALAALTPTLKDDHVLAKVTRVIDVLALNVGHAKNDPKDAK